MSIWPIKTVSEANSHQHWRTRQRRAKAQRADAAWLFERCELPATITMTRISVGTLDDDNLVGAMKHVRDGIADKLGIKDNDPRVTWRVAQRKGKRGEYGVEVTAEARP